MTPEQAKELIHTIGLGFALCSTWLMVLVILKFVELLGKRH